MKVSKHFLLEVEVVNLLAEEENQTALIESLLRRYYSGGIPVPEVLDRHSKNTQRYLQLSEGGSIPFDDLLELVTLGKKYKIEHAPIKTESVEEADKILQASMTPTP